MTKEKTGQQKLIEKYPNLLGSISSLVKKYGGSTEPGWDKLIEEACEKIESYRQRFPHITIAQIKEKFGRLTIYISGVEDRKVFEEIYTYLDELSLKSADICENCGTTEGVDTRGRHWIKSYCQKCEDTRDERRKAMALKIAENIMKPDDDE